LKKIAILLFAFLILLSSGFVQAVVHICPEKGIVLDKAECAMHSEQKPIAECCKKFSGYQKTIQIQKDDCCSDAFLFGVSPKFGSLDFQILQNPLCFYLPKIEIKSAPNFTYTSYTCFHSHSPPDFGIANRSLICIWLI